jgi:hypothetical protein
VDQTWGHELKVVPPPLQRTASEKFHTIAVGYGSRGYRTRRQGSCPTCSFASHFGQPQPRHQTLNWEALHIPRHDLSHLDADLSESEIDAAIAQLPAEKAPGPDGYIGAFFKQCWSIVKQNVVAAIREIFNLRGECWNLLNSANVALIAKIEEPQAIGDYRPTGIMHNMGKLLGKVLANQLSPHRIKLFHTSRVLS